MDEFENAIIRGIHISTYIASWTQCGYPANSVMRPWLKTLGLNDEEIKRIMDFAMNGRHDLQDTARRFMRSIGL